MKLAEALQERADLNRNISDLQNRLERVMLVQEGETPVENPKSLLRELNESAERLEYLMAAINHTNDQTIVNGRSLTQLIAKKDMLMRKINVYRNCASEAGMNTNRARGTEIKVVPTVKAAELQKEIDRMARELRLLDNSLQETNWTRELIE